MIATPEPLIRACIYCEIEHGILNRHDSRKTHGTCRRHLAAELLRNGIPQDDVDASLAALADADFCPDLDITRP